jgi:hypothetical protein
MYMRNGTMAKWRDIFILVLVLALMAWIGTGITHAAGTGAQVVMSDLSSVNALAPQGIANISTAALSGHKSHYGHYFATNYSDTPATAATLCEQPGVTGVVWRQAWNQVETAQGAYNFGAFDKVLAAIAHSSKPSCRLWLFVEFKSFASSPIKNPCPKYLKAGHSALNVYGNGAATCFMWQPVVSNAYTALIRAAAARFDANPRVEGFIIQESALGFSGQYSQDAGNGGDYTARAWRDSLISIVHGCSMAFAHSRCMAFVNFIRGGQSYVHDVSAAISAIPNNQACISGPDILPNEASLYDGTSAIYQVIVRHPGCRAESAQKASFRVPSCTLNCIFQFAVGGTMGAFPAGAPLSGGLCVNSYLFWDNKKPGPTTQDWRTAQKVMASHPYGSGWYGQCAGDYGPP